MSLRPQLDAIATLLDQGAADSAVRLLRGSWEPELPPGDLIPLYCLWIRALCETGDHDHALVLGKRAADEFPREPEVLIALGNVHDIREELEPAREAFERAIEVDPVGQLQRYNVGAVLERLGRDREAEHAYRRAFDSDDAPPMVEATAALGALLRRQDRLEEAEAVYDRYLIEDPLHADILVEHGICLSDIGRYEEAIDRFDLVLSIVPKHASALYNQAITHFRMGQNERAISTMHEARRADPANPLTLAVLGSWLLGAGDADLDEALGLVYRAFELLGDTPEPTAASYAGLVAEEVFEALWQHDRKAEAREIARVAGQRDWITPHMFDVLNQADYGMATQATAFCVTARAEACLAPEHWPEDAGGYTTGLIVLANDEDEARRFTLEYLRSLEPSPGVYFHVDVIAPGGEGLPEPLAKPRASGVARVNGSRAYFRS